VRSHVNYEGQAAIELEALAAKFRGEHAAYPLPAAAGEEGLVLDPRETIRALDHDVLAGLTPGLVAARFHNAIAAGTAAACEAAARQHGLDTVVLSGGVFQNRLLLEQTSALIAGAGLHILIPHRLPANDGAISYGQAAVAAATARS
jgi:hydrogenase maturation protein HypF